MNFQAKNQQEKEAILADRTRLHKRLKLYNLRERREIAPDGNCLFRAISDQ